LVLRAAQGDPGAFAELYEYHSPAIRNYVHSVVRDHQDAQDITHDVFFNALKAVGRYTHTGAPFSAWLYRIAHNLSINHLKSRRKHSPLEDADHLPTTKDHPESLAERAERKKVVRGAVASLKGHKRRVLVMRFFLGYDHTDIARVLRKTEGAVRVIQHRALTELREILKPPFADNGDPAIANEWVDVLLDAPPFHGPAASSNTGQRLDRPVRKVPVTLVEKLRLKPGFKAIAINAPPQYVKRFGKLLSAELGDTAKSKADFVQLFVRARWELETLAPAALSILKPDGLLWISYPRRKSEGEPGLDGDTLCEAMKKYGKAGLTMISIDSAWSAIRFQPAASLNNTSRYPGLPLPSLSARLAMNPNGRHKRIGDAPRLERTEHFC
jgi:RNA polymerase sigma-70 factor (ECF subfamily)